MHIDICIHIISYFCIYLGDKSPQTFFALLAADLERARRGGSLFFRKLKLKDSTDACRDKILTDWVLMILNDCSDSVKADSNLSTLINEVFYVYVYIVYLCMFIQIFNYLPKLWLS